jgi:transmembrane sensor
MKSGRAGRIRISKRRRQAADWLAHRVTVDKWSPGKQRKWQKWMADPRNQKAYDEVEYVATVLRKRPPRSLPTEAELRAGWWGIALNTPGGYLACGVKGSVALAAIALALRILLAKTPCALVCEYETARGEFRDITLDDRSTISLGGSSKLTVYVSQQQRSVVLQEGEALFRIMPDPRHPFRVEAGDARVTEIGTTFHIRRYADGQVDVSVGEGSVIVTDRARETSNDVSSETHSRSRVWAAPIEVRMGEAVSLDATGELGALRPIDLQAVTEWLHGRRFYHDTSLAKIIEDLQLYSVRRIEFERDVGALQFTGVVEQSNPEQWVRGLPIVLPVEVDDTDPHRLFIRCRAAGCKTS